MNRLLNTSYESRANLEGEEVEGQVPGRDETSDSERGSDRVVDHPGLLKAVGGFKQVLKD